MFSTVIARYLVSLIFIAAAGHAVIVPAYAQTKTIDWRYTVKPHDTVSELAKQYLKPQISWKTLAKYNGLNDPDTILTGTRLRIPLQWLSVQQARARITAISGKVLVQTFDGSWRPAQKDQLLQTGEQVQVGSNSSARLRFADDSELTIQPDSTVALDTLSIYPGGFMADTRLRLQSGRVEVLANPHQRAGQKFEVVTPAAVAFVRGTNFLVEASDAQMLQQTFEGKVALQVEGAQVLVTQGYGSRVATGEKPVPPTLIKPAPVLQDAAANFLDFPIQFSWQEQTEISSWVLQIGRDAQMSELVWSLHTKTPHVDASFLPDGSYFVRAWTIDNQGMPSRMAEHAFRVEIPRKLSRPPVQLLPNYFAKGTLELQLAPAIEGQRYMVVITSDNAGRNPVWFRTDAPHLLGILPPGEPNQTHYLWVWTY